MNKFRVHIRTHIENRTAVVTAHEIQRPGSYPIVVDFVSAASAVQFCLWT